MKTIEFDPFDSDSIDRAVIALRKYEKERERLIALYVQKLAQCGEVAAQRTYGSLVSVKSHKTADGTWEILANGDQVVFLEFGTGVYTHKHEIAGNNLGITIEPGSWSESPEGKHTWSQWLNSWTWNHKDYPYNTHPRPGMYEAYKAIVANQDRIAKEVFG